MPIVKVKKNARFFFFAPSLHACTQEVLKILISF